jgi:hypothetical protein
MCSSEGTARASQHIPYKQYSEIPEQVIFKLYLARVQIVIASVPEVTSMQVFECIGEEWKSPLQISLLEVCLPRGVQGL